MKPSLETRVSLAILFAVVLAQAIILAPELTTASYRNSDNVSHYALIHGMVDAVEHGDNPLDFWSAETSLGVPLARLYQPLSHLLVAGTYFLLGKTVSLWTVFTWAKYLSMVLLPVPFFFAAIWLDLPPLTAAAAALLMPLIAGPGPGQLGMDLRSWIGFGLFPQAVGAGFLLLSLGFAFRAVRKGRHMVAAGALIGLTLIAHLIYGWMAALSTCLLAVMPDREVPRIPRIRRTFAIGAVAALVAAFQLIPVITDGYLINRSRSEPAEKYDSFGAPKVLEWLFTGQIMDHERIPVLSLLVFFGAGLFLWRWRKTRKLAPEHTFLLLGALFWLMVFFGRPTWGVLLTLIGVTPDLHLHRVIGAVQVFLLFLAAIALDTLWRQAARRWHFAAAAGLTAVLLAPLAMERLNWVNSHMELEQGTFASIQRYGSSLDQAIALAKQRGGRVFAGLRGTWGPRFALGRTPVYAFLTTGLTPTITDAYNQTALTSDLIGHFNQTRASEYRVFNIRTVLTIPEPGAPAFLKFIGDIGHFRVFEAPGEGYFGLVDVVASADTNRDNFFDIADPWLHSDWPDRHQYIWLDFHGDAPRNLPRLTPGYLPAIPPAPTPPGTVLGERQSGQIYEADLDVARSAWVLFRMTFHPAWKVLVDGRSVATAMLSPGLVGAQVVAGRHHIVCRYQPGNLKWMLLGAGWGITLLLLVFEYRRGSQQRS
ncbi:MAG TPA: hypothetical protein VMJ75_10945 [Candidatus Acidoferrales bacterium]|nr:hypothetical protein [Candidatus Acidoferrales bacterium]